MLSRWESTGRWLHRRPRTMRRRTLSSARISSGVPCFCSSTTSGLPCFWSSSAQLSSIAFPCAPCAISSRLRRPSISTSSSVSNCWLFMQRVSVRSETTGGGLSFSTTWNSAGFWVWVRHFRNYLHGKFIMVAYNNNEHKHIKIRYCSYSLFYSILGMNKWLHRRGFSWKKPTGVPHKFSEEKQQQFMAEWIWGSEYGGKWQGTHPVYGCNASLAVNKTEWWLNTQGCAQTG